MAKYVYDENGKLVNKIKTQQEVVDERNSLIIFVIFAPAIILPIGTATICYQALIDFGAHSLFAFLTWLAVFSSISYGFFANKKLSFLLLLISNLLGTKFIADLVNRNNDLPWVIFWCLVYFLVVGCAYLYWWDEKFN